MRKKILNDLAFKLKTKKSKQNITPATTTASSASSFPPSVDTVESFSKGQQQAYKTPQRQRPKKKKANQYDIT